ncbi:hypothetical protein CYMTET_16352 [Cymbomonas tetramitiformis]|uniref:F-box domain-containing protein n=1 Tax=Cymbomonas tetramitiformis TaxID=36881 RepID=A0AAE0GCP5_9CHLO|nr:hypothetical protein CYMTET_16352 [Cymbomonas tetramitiformis]
MHFVALENSTQVCLPIVSARKEVTFLSTGDVLREQGLLDSYMQNPTPLGKDELRSKARGSVRQACVQLAASHAHASGYTGLPRVLVLECIKETEDVFWLMDELGEHGLPLLQAIWLPRETAMISPGFMGHQPEWNFTHEAERRVKERRDKWRAHCGRVIELLSSTGKLVILQRFESDLFSTVSYVSRTYGDDKATCWLVTAGWCDQNGQWICDQERQPLCGTGLSQGRPPGIKFNSKGASTGGRGQLRVTALQPLSSSQVVTSGKKRAELMASVQLEVHGVDLTSLPVPIRSLTTLEDALWVACPGRYCVARKCDGTRHLLVRSVDHVVFMNRLGTMYQFPLSPTAREALPPGTVLDGELVWGDAHSACGCFFAFDILSSSGSPTWHLPFTARQAELEALGLPSDTDGLDDVVDAFRSVMGSPASVSRPVKGRGKRGKQPKPKLATWKTQAPGSAATVAVVHKVHLPVNAKNIQALAKGSWYPADGLVFTPSTAGYSLGQAELLLRWQPLQHVCVDKFLEFGSQDFGVVFETSAETGGLLSVRLDKACGNSHLRHAQVRQLVIGRIFSQTLDLRSLITACYSSRGSRASMAPGRLLVKDGPLPHPAFRLPFGQLYAELIEACATGAVERTVEAHSALEVFNYRSHAPATPLHALCRGLVVHPPTCQVVAMPFVRFCESIEAAAEGGDFRLYPEEVKKFLTEPAEFSLKVDGSLAIAFLWDGEVRVATRRRLDSEQAVWAQAQLRGSARTAAAFQPGWTYLFEVVYDVNRLLVRYPFEGLVLLAAVSPEGVELSPWEARAQLAAQMGVTVAPTFTATLQEVLTQWPRLNATGLQSEGYVINFPERGRSKLVHPVFSRAHQAVSDLAGLHPKKLWELIRCGWSRGAVLEQRLAGVAPHVVAEGGRILDALEANYREALKYLQCCSCRKPLDQPSEIILSCHHYTECSTGVCAMCIGAPPTQCVVCGGSLRDALASCIQGGLVEASQSACPHVGTEGPDVSHECERVQAGGGIQHCSMCRRRRGAASTVEIEAAVMPLSQRFAQVVSLGDELGLGGQVRDDEYKVEFEFVPSELENGSVLRTPYYLPIAFDPASSRNRVSLLRCKLLDCIAPADDGMLRGYTPSDNFKHTWAKGWCASMPQQQGPMLKLPSDLLCGVLSFLSAAELAEVMFLCKAFVTAVLANAGLIQRVSEYHKRQAALSLVHDSDDEGKPYFDQEDHEDHFRREWDGNMGYGST